MFWMLMAECTSFQVDDDAGVKNGWVTFWRTVGHSFHSSNYVHATEIMSTVTFIILENRLENVILLSSS